MRSVRNAANVSGAETDEVSAKTLRRWCAPELILAVTDLSDELVIMPHVINQARHGNARIILAHVVTSDAEQLQCRNTGVQRRTSRIHQARIALDRMARHLRWLGFVCEPLVLSGRPEVEIPTLARSFSVDRVIFAMEDNPEFSLRHIPTLAELVLPGIEVPACIIGRCVSLSNRMFTRSITLAVSLDSDCDAPLGFGSRLAQELHAKLTVFHAFPRYEPSQEFAVRTPQTLAASLPSPTWREAELLCPTEIAVSEGDAADELLKYCSSSHQDLIILCSRGTAPSEQNWRNSVTYRVLAGAQCPVLVLDRGVSREFLFNSTSSSLQRTQAHGGIPIENIRMQANVSHKVGIGREVAYLAHQQECG